MNEGMLHNFSGEGVEFLLGRQLSPEDKICDLHEGALLSEHLDGISSILKDSSISINEGDSWGTGDGVHVSWIICSQHLSLVGELGEISWFNEAAICVELMSLASPGVNHGDGVLLCDLFGNEVQAIHKI